MKRTPLTRKTPLKRTPLRRRTPLAITASMVVPASRLNKKRSHRGHRVPAKIARGITNRSRGQCEASIVCVGASTSSLHHRLMKAHRIVDTPGNLRDLCAECHGTIHRVTGWAYRHGWLVLSTSDPDDVETWFCALECHVDHVGVGHHGGDPQPPIDPERES